MSNCNLIKSPDFSQLLSGRPRYESRRSPGPKPGGPPLFNYADGQISETNEAIKLTHQLTVNNSGLGWGIGNIGTRYKKYEHSGGTKGFSTHVRVFPEIKAGLIILANNDVGLAKLIQRLSPLVVQ